MANRLPALKKMKSRDTIGPLCPRCESFLHPRIGFRAGALYECKNCGYVGPLFVRIPKKEKRNVR